jgi:hypothetical protein
MLGWLGGLAGLVCTAGLALPATVFLVAASPSSLRRTSLPAASTSTAPPTSPRSSCSWRACWQGSATSDSPAQVAGIVAGAWGNPAILAYSNRIAPNDQPDIAYAMILPGMTILKILFVDEVPAFF